MTARKDDIVLRGDRTPAFVSRDIGAAELSISPATWDDWVKAGTLPAPAVGFPESSPRWCWEDVNNRLRGAPANAEQAIIEAAGRLRLGRRNSDRGKAPHGQHRAA